MQSGDHTEGRYVSVEKAAKAMELNCVDERPV